MTTTLWAPVRYIFYAESYAGFTQFPSRRELDIGMSNLLPSKVISCHYDAVVLLSRRRPAFSERRILEAEYLARLDAL